jgi:hypothetical protein
LVSPVTEQVVAVLDVEEGHASVVGVEVVVFSAVTVYPVIALPPVFVGAVQLTVTKAFPFAGVPMVGAPGTPSGVTLAEELENGPVPTTLMAATVNVYASPMESPVTVQVVAVLDVDEGHASVVGVEVVTFSAVTVYPVIALPPVFIGALQLTVAEPFPFVGVPMVGAPGTVNESPARPVARAATIGVPRPVAMS